MSSHLPAKRHETPALTSPHIHPNRTRPGDMPVGLGDADVNPTARVERQFAVQPNRASAIVRPDGSLAGGLNQLYARNRRRAGDGEVVG